MIHKVSNVDAKLTDSIHEILIGLDTIKNLVFSLQNFAKISIIRSEASRNIRKESFPIMGDTDKDIETERSHLRN